MISSIPQISCPGLPTFGVPPLASSNVSNSLTDENNFIQFTDGSNRQLGVIRAQSIEDWRNKTLDAAYFFEVMGKFVGMDFVKGMLQGANELYKISKKFSNIGVEYVSGHGDYAEWLERADVAENITAGDIVSVRGGKITKNLAGAEQIMVASHRPIVLGNMPEENRRELGNSVAFMGQVPVKLMGPVVSGDYIVAKSSFAGMGIAIHPADMTEEDYRLAVGRSWETNENEGPKIVNTVVGIHNNDFLKIVSGLRQKSEETEKRLQLLEEKLNIAPQDNKEQKNKTKKAF